MTFHKLILAVAALSLAVSIIAAKTPEKGTSINLTPIFETGFGGYVDVTHSLDGRMVWMDLTFEDEDIDAPITSNIYYWDKESGVTKVDLKGYLNSIGIKFYEFPSNGIQFIDKSGTILITYYDRNYNYKRIVWNKDRGFNLFNVPGLKDIFSTEIYGDLLFILGIDDQDLYKLLVIQLPLDGLK